MSVRLGRNGNSMITYDVNGQDGIALVSKDDKTQYVPISEAGEIKYVSAFILRQMHYVASHDAVGMIITKIYDYPASHWKKHGPNVVFDEQLRG